MHLFEKRVEDLGSCSKPRPGGWLRPMSYGQHAERWNRGLPSDCIAWPNKAPEPTTTAVTSPANESITECMSGIITRWLQEPCRLWSWLIFDVGRICSYAAITVHLNSGESEFGMC